ncbi:MAG TPA: DUF751 family protein [Leptolyngbyaceae cyanobacterium]
MFDGLWAYISRYLRYFVTIILGIFLNAFGYLTPLYKSRIGAIALVGLFTGLIFFVFFTLRAMLGLSPLF